MSPLSAREAEARRQAAAAAAAAQAPTPEAADGCFDYLGAALQDLLDCVTNQFAECDRLPGLVSLVPGASVAHDNCCEDGGQLYVRLAGLFPSGRPFPTADTVQRCGVTLLAARVMVGAIRCAHTLDDEGNPPAAELMTDDALQGTADALTILRALTCCESRWVKISSVERWNPVGPQGGCAGGEWGVILGLDWCGC
jgi:hypothetical protein